ncbi:TPA: hypothetical protein ACGR4R_001425 [Aeromonas veronii]
MEQQSTHQGLVVECVDGQLRISVGVNTLASALATGSNGMRKLSVIDAEVFAKEVAKDLTRSLDWLLTGSLTGLNAAPRQRRINRHTMTVSNFP